MAFIAVIRQQRIIEEYLQTVKVSAQSVKHDNIGRNNQKVGGQFGIRLRIAYENSTR